MPANLPPEYFEVEKRYRDAKRPADKIAALQAMLAVIPKHKGTDKLRGDLRRRLSKLKSKDQAKKPGIKRDSPFKIQREGAAQVILVAPPNVGKSALVAVLTNADPEVGDFPHTTWKPVPGMMPYENIQVQLIDTPPMTIEYTDPQLLDMIRRADMILLVVDVSTDPTRQLEEVAAILEENRIAPVGLGHEAKAGWSYKTVLVLANKCDDALAEENFDIFNDLVEQDWPMLAVSAKTGRNLDLLKKTVFERLEIIRVYTKGPGKEPDRTAPFVLKRGSTVEDLAVKIHKDFLEKLKYAKIWGNKVYDGQMIQRDYVLQDGDVVELHV
ncbi:MAG: TGS domain-containing protein [Desulfobacterales bacterium]|nr:TGS domain-containing protein [Desulfobacterales bacterium]